MSDVLKTCAKSVLEKMNLFVVLQIAWIIEFHILAIFSTKYWFYGMTEEQMKVPAIIGEYSQKIANWMDTYNDFIFFNTRIYLNLNFHSFSSLLEYKTLSYFYLFILHVWLFFLNTWSL